MTTVIIVVLLIAVILFAFSRDREKMLNRVEFSGGLQEKYRVFLSLLTKNDGLKIVTVNKSYILLRKNENSIVIQLMITQSFNKVLISWKTVTTGNIINTININWEFSDRIDQKLMFDKILNDIADRQNEELNKISNKYIT